MCTSLDTEPGSGELARPRQFATPREDGGKVVWPSVEASSALIAESRHRLTACDYDVQGLTLTDLSTEARRQLLAEALRYTRSYRDVSLPESAEASPAMPSLVLAGHQPELFHPGVWLKNFLLDSVAQSNGAAAVNLLVDSDTIKTSSLRVPTGPRDRPLVESVLFDRPQAAIPYEERRIEDRAMFDSFADRAADKLASLVSDPLLKQFWSDVLDRSRHTKRLGECLSQARHLWEGRWGTQTLEIPQSHVCSLPAFHRFAAHLLAHLPRLWEIYNAALFEYRKANHIRSHAHPVPELAIEDDWLEAPFWVWRAKEPTRRRLFVRSVGSGVVLADRAGWEETIDLSADGDLEKAIEQLQELGGRGIRLRTRALITTLLARVLLGDLFLHGIGGAKYDQMTDVLIERFFGLVPPGYMVVSGTLRLPIEHRRGAGDEFRRARQTLRGMTYHPERFIEPTANTTRCERCSSVAGGAEPQRSVALKQHWIDTPKTPENARERHEAIRSANLALQPWVADRRAKLLTEIERLEQRARADAILSSREYSFCLYPESQLREFLTGQS